MRIKIKDTHQFILVFDTEYDGDNLVQFAGIMLKKVDAEHYELYRTGNVFVKQKLSKYFTKYTKLTQDYIDINGVSLEKAKEEILDKFLCNINTNSILVTSHGVKNDLRVLYENGISLSHDDWYYYDLDSYCTHNHSQKALGRNSRLGLDDVAREGNFINAVPHNAFVDAWATLIAFCYLKEKEEQQC